VIITAAVAMTGVTGGDVGEARNHLEQRLAVVTERIGLPVAHLGRTITSADVRRLEDDDQ
jgi:hypothetical protein